MSVHLQSSSNIVVVSGLLATNIRLLGSEDWSMVILNVSLASNILSSFIGTSNKVEDSPAKNVTVYGPEP